MGHSVGYGVDILFLRTNLYMNPVRYAHDALSCLRYGPHVDANLVGTGGRQHASLSLGNLNDALPERAREPYHGIDIQGEFPVETIDRVASDHELVVVAAVGDANQEKGSPQKCPNEEDIRS